jgi:hypothetical protein
MKTMTKYNISARIYSYSVNPKGFLEVVLYKGNRKKEPELFSFVIYNRIVASEMIRLIEKVGCKRFKCKFYINTKEWNKKLYTSLVIIECKEWLTIKQVVSGGLNEPEPKLSLNWNQNTEFIL